MTNFNILVTGGQQEEDLVNDGWTDIIRKLSMFNASRASEDESNARRDDGSRRACGFREDGADSRARR